jgi:DNA helicase HerA-like ATPase
MEWIVLGQQKGLYKLISKTPKGGKTVGLLPKGSYLTLEQSDGGKVIMRVDESAQYEPYSPSPLIVDMDISGLQQDQKCLNVVGAYPVLYPSTRDDGLIEPIKPQSLARRSTQEEVDLAIGEKRGKGPKVFLSSIYGSENRLLKDEKNNYITACLPEEMYYHQTAIFGTTGSGKSVAAKYLAQYFVEEMDGCVLAINIKDDDLLKMDKPSQSNEQIEKEWKTIGGSSKKVEKFTIYYPANTTIPSSEFVDSSLCEKISLDVNKIDPIALTALLRGITDIAAQFLPNIFRYWREECRGRFQDFYNYFQELPEDRQYHTINSRGERGLSPPIPHGTYGNILRQLDDVVEYFDNPDGIFISAEDIIKKREFSVINVEDDLRFGSIVLRHLLKDIVNYKRNNLDAPPVLIIIDEVHEFYSAHDSKEALDTLDKICRKGRARKIGIIFATQEMKDIPSGLESVINTKLFFKTDIPIAKQYGISRQEMDFLKQGYAVGKIWLLPQVKIIKFPLSFSGVPVLE